MWCGCYHRRFRAVPCGAVHVLSSLTTIKESSAAHFPAAREHLQTFSGNATHRPLAWTFFFPQLRQAAAWRQERGVDSVLAEERWSRHEDLQAEMFWLGK